MKKQFAVLGLGTFGKSVALTLEGLGCDVVAVDNSLEKVQDISDSVAYAMRADVADPEAFVIGGGVARAGQILIDAVQKYYRQYAFHAAGNAEFRAAVLGNSAGIYGGVKMVLAEEG